MCRKLLLMACIAVLGILPRPTQAQSVADAIQQLTLDYQKLDGLKSILKQMQQGYQMVSKGYGAVKDVSKGNFTLHQAFLDGLMLVSPTVRNYPRVKDIISDQASVLSEYKSAYGAFKQDKHITPDEIRYMATVYDNLVAQSTANLNELDMVMTDNKMRMSDNDRIKAIDRIFMSGRDQLTFLRKFNAQTRSVAVARAQEANDRQTLKQLYGISTP